MPATGSNGRRITAFRVGDDYVFSHYFEREDLYADLREHHLPGEYRFEVPADEFGRVRDRLTAADFRVEVVEDPEPYCVVTEKYAKHAHLLRNCVVDWERRDHRFFLMESLVAAEQAVAGGATPVSETEFAMGL